MSSSYLRSYAIIFIIGINWDTVLAHPPSSVPQTGPKPPYNVPDLPLDHYPYWLRNSPFVKTEFKKICNISDILNTEDVDVFTNAHNNLTFEDKRYINDIKHGQRILSTICDKISIVYKLCWGYEHGCDSIYLMPECKGQDTARSSKLENWFNSADFGYIRQRRDELQKFCIPNSNDASASSLECTKYFKICRGKHLRLKVPKLSETELSLSNFYRDDLIGLGDVGGYNCDLQTKRIPEESGQRGELQSWYDELHHYTNNFTDDRSKCDREFDKPVYVMKLDSTSNFYHHLNDFFNLYASQHYGNNWQHDNQIIIWNQHHTDTNFNLLWNVFTKNPIMSIASEELRGKTLCFNTFMMPFPSRMTGGLFYNTPLEPDCHKSGLFKAFNHHVFHRLGIGQNELDIESDIIRVTFLVRSTPHRNILNINDLLQTVKTRFDIQRVRLEAVDFNHKVNLSNQLGIIRNTDVLIGIHGAGLAHTIFLPDWATLFEIYNCGEVNCYRDLARLRGVSYVTWNNHTSLRPSGGKPEYGPKFVDYNFDPHKFVQILESAIKKAYSKRREHYPNLKPYNIPTAKPIETKKDTLELPLTPEAEQLSVQVPVKQTLIEPSIVDDVQTLVTHPPASVASQLDVSQTSQQSIEKASPGIVHSPESQNQQKNPAGTVSVDQAQESVPIPSDAAPSPSLVNILSHMTDSNHSAASHPESSPSHSDQSASKEQDRQPIAPFKPATKTFEIFPDTKPSEIKHESERPNSPPVQSQSNSPDQQVKQSIQEVQSPSPSASNLEQKLSQPSASSPDIPVGKRKKSRKLLRRKNQDIKQQDSNQPSLPSGGGEILPSSEPRRSQDSNPKDPQSVPIAPPGSKNEGHKDEL